MAAVGFYAVVQKPSSCRRLCPTVVGKSQGHLHRAKIVVLLQAARNNHAV